jgi:sugar/nucleoside kinase (ribokinase family)
MAWDVFGLGNALVDALVVLDDQPVVQRHDLHRGTMHLVNDARWQGVYSEVDRDAVQLHPGGSCANTVSTIAHLGGNSTFCGLVGKDDLGATYGDRMSEILGGHHLVWRDEMPTGKCLSLISDADAERTMLTDLGASMHLEPTEVPLDAVEAANWLHITGYLFTGGRMGDAAMAALETALQAGTHISIDVGDTFVIDHAREAVDQVFQRYANLVFMNAEEGRAIGHGNPMRALMELGETVRTVVLKLGRRGSLILHEGELIPVEATPVVAVDTTGAGDAYAGGFLYGHTRGWPLQACGRLAAEVAALTVSQVGGVARDVAQLQEIVDRLAPEPAGEG